VTLYLHASALRTPIGDSVEAVAGAIAAGAAMADLAAPKSPRHARLLGPIGALAVEVAAEAAGRAGLVAGERTGVFAATGGIRASWDQLMPAMAEQQPGGVGAWRRGLSRMHPLWILRYLSTGASGLIAAELGARGDGAVFAGPAAAASALAAAEQAIAAGAIDQAIVVAADTLVAPEVRVELARRRPDVVPGAGVVAAVVSAAPGGAALDAADGVDSSLEPSPAAIARVRERLPAGGRERSFARSTGHLGAAGLLCDAVIAAHFAWVGWPAALDTAGTTSICVGAGAPGQVGIIRVEVNR
jgi:hypothetical protein